MKQDSDQIRSDQHDRVSADLHVWRTHQHYPLQEQGHQIANDTSKGGNLLGVTIQQLIQMHDKTIDAAANTKSNPELVSRALGIYPRLTGPKS
eukprot:768553-Hanusia_phi.AAC.3